MRVSIIGFQQSDFSLLAERRAQPSERGLFPGERRGVAHAVAAGDIEPAAEPAPLPPLRLALHGLTTDEASILEAILRVLGDRTARRWVLADGVDGDLLLTRRGDVPRATTAAMTALLLRDDETPASPDELALQGPLRVMAVLDLLNAAHDRLRQPQVQLRVTGEQPRIEGDDGKSLAAALARLVARRPDQALRVRIVGHGTLYLCLTSRIYHCDFPRERFADALNEHRFVVTMIPSTSAEIVVRLEDAWPVDEALWQIGLVTAMEGCDVAGKAYKLTRWPDFARLPHRFEYLKLCAAMARTHRPIETLVEMSGMRRGDVEHLLHACGLCGYLDVSLQPQQATAAPANPATARIGLFDRLRRRFGL